MEDRSVQPIGKVSHTRSTGAIATAASPFVASTTANSPAEHHDENVVQRLKRRIKDAQEMGFKVRRELLDDEEASWCIVGTTKTLFLDLAQTASEQLRQLNETLDSYQNHLAKASAASEAESSSNERAA